MITKEQEKELILLLKDRYNRNQLVKDIDFDNIKFTSDKLWSLHQMEITGGEPSLIAFDNKTFEYIFCDTSKESPIGRRSLCYDKEALDKRKENKPLDSVINVATKMKVNLLDEKEYRLLQSLVECDTKTSSWIKTDSDIRDLGGALFGDRRYNKVFIYHNGADSYYGSRGFRASLRV
jgi:hypothetical protein